MAITSRRRLGAAALAAWMLAGHPVLAQDFPSKPIRVIVPAAPGGSLDILGRILSKIIAEQRGVPVVIENRTGASGSIGVAAVIRAPADGYTLLFSVPDAVSVYPLLKKNAPYQVGKDLVPITRIATANYVFAINGSSKANTLKEFLDLAKGGQMTYSSQGTGSSGHLVSELFKRRTGVELLHVPYNGAAPAALAVVTGETHMTNGSPTTLKSFLDTGKLKALAITRTTRATSLPNVPTMIESGYPDFVATTWFGLFAPAGVSEAVVEKLNEIVLAAVSTPDFLKQAASLGLEMDPLSRRDFGQFLANESAEWKKMIEIAKVPLED